MSLPTTAPPDADSTQPPRCGQTTAVGGAVRQGGWVMSPHVLEGEREQSWHSRRVREHDGPLGSLEPSYWHVGYLRYGPVNRHRSNWGVEGTEPVARRAA